MTPCKLMSWRKPSSPAAWVIPCLGITRSNGKQGFCFAQTFWFLLMSPQKTNTYIVCIIKYIHIYSGYFFRFCVCFPFQICLSETNNVILPPKNVILLPASGVMASDVMAWRYLDQFLEISQSNFSNRFALIFLVRLWGALVWSLTVLKYETIQGANRCQRSEPLAGWNISYFTHLHFFFENHLQHLKWGDVMWRRIMIVHIQSHVELKKWPNKTSEMLLGITSQPDS